MLCCDPGPGSAGLIDFSPPEFLVESGPEGVFVAHYSPGCYSDVGDARLYRELVKEG